MAEAGVAWVIGAGRDRGNAIGGAGSGRPTPHLTSPLEGGREQKRGREGMEKREGKTGEGG